jgi:hypothetical protein
MITKPTNKAKDKRIVFKDERVVTDSNTWVFDGKYDPATGKLKVYRVNGDITTGEHKDAIYNHIKVKLGVDLV